MRPTFFGTVAGKAFSPSDIEGLVLWLKADAIEGVDDGDPVTVWSDSSGNENDATSGANALTYLTNVQNGKPAVRFIEPTNTNKSYATTPSISAITDWTLFAVVTDYATSATYALCGGNDTHAILADYLAYKNEYYNSPRTTIGDLGYFGLHVLTCDVGSTATGVWTIGGEPSHSAINMVGWTVAELIAYDSALSSDNKTSVQAYLTAKYAIIPESVLWCAGDSLTVSYSTNVSDPTQTYPALLTGDLSTLTSTTWYNGGDDFAVAEVGADTARILQLMQLNMTPHYGGSQRNNTCVVWGGTNDIGAGGTAAAALSGTLACVNEAYNNDFVLSNGLVPVLNMLPRQDLGAGNAAFEASRTTYNAGLAATVSGKGLVVNVAGITELQDPTNTTYYLSDKVHLTNAGYALVANAVYEAIEAYIN